MSRSVHRALALALLCLAPSGAWAKDAGVEFKAVAKGGLAKTSFKIAAGEYVMLLGPSGSGKTTPDCRSCGDRNKSARRDRRPATGR